jgi:hypothetical protein
MGGAGLDGGPVKRGTMAGGPMRADLIQFETDRIRPHASRWPPAPYSAGTIFQFLK